MEIYLWLGSKAQTFMENKAQLQSKAQRANWRPASAAHDMR